MRYESQVLRLQTDSDYSKRLPIHLCGELPQAADDLFSADGG